MSDTGAKTQLDRICHALTRRFGPLPALRAWRPNESSPLQPPTSSEQVAEAERLLGFALPPLMRAIYLCIGNGGEVLAMAGLDPVRRAHHSALDPLFDVVAGYVECVAAHPTYYREDWPAKRVPIFYHGCSVVSCVDCSTPAGTVWRVNEGRWSVAYPSLVEHVEGELGSAWPF